MPDARTNSAAADAAADAPEERKASVVVLRDFCTRFKGTQCDRCEKACPKSAISYTPEELPLIDTNRCTLCGICFGICDAFSSTRVTMLDLHERVRKIAAKGETVHCTCQENVFPELDPAANVVILPCLACLSPEFWTVVLSENIPVKIACDLSYCDGCAIAGENAEMLYTHAIHTAEIRTNSKIGFSNEIPEKENLLKGFTSSKGIDRRSIFTNFAGDVSDIATGKRSARNSEVIARFTERRERSKALNQLRFANSETINFFSPSGRAKKILHPKQQMLLEAVAANPAIAQNIPVQSAVLDKQLCEGARACMKVCPTGALSPDPGVGKTVLDQRYCIGCGLCIQACAACALSLETKTAVCLIPKNATDKKQVDNKAGGESSSDVKLDET
ncbi:MAG: 4Fe-4S dicluster domain-containing protein [Coriobacteriaceae bacterium]|jgi:Pyruvate/2-oxoacid:ferredoxin oxidoreductase delta subunit|nr:4Fe-4S dicluster domain-containing protein [Coriobacteriaceae bacterium]